MKPCPTCNDERMIRSLRSGCLIPCPTCRVDDAAAYHERKTHDFRPETLTDDEAELVNRMTPEEQAYLCGRLVESESPDRAALFEQMRRIVSERIYGTAFNVSEARTFLRKWPSTGNPRDEYIRGLLTWLCSENEKLTKAFAELDAELDSARAALPDDPPEGCTLPEAIRALRNRIGDLENALRFYADNKNYETLATTGHSRVETDFGLIARDALPNPRAGK